MSLSKIRFYIFWLIDFIKGGKIKKHLNEIKLIQENFSSNKSKSFQQTYKNNLLEHATNTTEFYKKFKNISFSEFPVINKNDIRNNKLLFQSENYKNKPKKHVSSSGSTGATISVYLNKSKTKRNAADNIYFYNLAGYKVGQKLFYIRIWLYKIYKLPLWLKNIEAVDILQFNNKNYILSLLEKITKSKKIKNIIGYASALEKLCVFLDKNNYKPIKNSNIKSVIAIAESLNNYTKEKVEYYFNTKIYSRYSNSENGIIAQQLPGYGNNFVINWASYFVEVLKFDSDLPVDEGETGRIVITDLFNYGMPMIRYDTGDVGVIDYTTNPPVFTKVEGRKSDVIYNTKGKIVSSLIIVRPHLSKGVIQTQLIQEKQKDYILKLNVSKDFNDEKIIIDEFKNYLGTDANINIEYTDEIPSLSSGKTRATINNYINNSQKKLEHVE